MVDSVSTSAAAQHIEASIERTNNHPDSGGGLCCQYRFLEVELRIWANSGIAHRFAHGWIFLNVGFRLRFTNYAATGQPRFQRGYVTYRTEALAAKADHPRWAMRIHHR